MKRKFIITALSDKNNEYCVSGVDMQDNKHYRLCSSNTSTCRAVDQYCLFYVNNTKVKVLDVCEVEIVESIPEDMQPENILVNWAIKPVHIGEITKDMLAYCVTNHKHVFFNGWRKVDPNNLILNGDSKHSLELISVDKLTIEYRVPFYGGHAKLYGRFRYKGVLYDEISITDPKIKAQYYQKELGEYTLLNPLILLSLGVLYEGYNYKLIASVII